MNMPYDPPLNPTEIQILQNQNTQILTFTCKSVSNLHLNVRNNQLLILIENICLKMSMVKISKPKIQIPQPKQDKLLRKSI